MENQKILHLTLKKVWFDLMKKGDKTIEVRKPSKWILSRLENKEYDFIKFRHGYAKNADSFMAKYKGYEVQKELEQLTYIYNDRFVLAEAEKGDVIIHFELLN